MGLTADRFPPGVVTTTSNTDLDRARRGPLWPLQLSLARHAVEMTAARDHRFEQADG